MEEDDEVGQLLELCDQAPEEALARIEMLDPELAGDFPVRFGKFLALRHLALDQAIAQGYSGEDCTEEAAGRLFGSSQLARAAEALETIAAIEAEDLDYLSTLSSDGDHWGMRLVDSVAVPLERVKPGSVQAILGWTKLFYLGNERIGFAPGLLEQLPSSLVKAALHARISNADPFTSVVATSWSGSEPAGHMSVELLEQDYRATPTIGDAGMIGTALLFEDGHCELREQEATNDRSGLDHPNREHLLAESEMLLRYETDSARRAFLEQTLVWLNGQGPRPESSSVGQERRNSGAQGVEADGPVDYGTTEFGMGKLLPWLAAGGIALIIVYSML